MELFFDLFYEYSELLAKIVLCSVLAGIIGYNREKNGMIVGIRTHILVALSALLLQVIVLEFVDNTGYTGDVLRIAGQLVSGVGFLGAGAIIKDNRSIKGLTTAASIFLVACIGLSVGLGIYGPSVIITLVAYSFLIDLFGLKKTILTKRTSSATFNLEVDGLYNEHSSEIVDSLRTVDVEIDSIEISTVSMTKSKVTLKVKLGDEVCANDVLLCLITTKCILKAESIDA